MTFMFSFKTLQRITNDDTRWFFVEGKDGKNVHLEHLEDEVLNGGVEGVKTATDFLIALRDMLAGQSKSETNITMKWDGAPAVFCGLDPVDQKFFVGTKGVFAKNPKVCKSEQDVDEFYPSTGLNPKLKLALSLLSQANIPAKEVWQGDMMWTTGDLSSENIDGNPYTTFQPNTIVYAVPSGTALDKEIKKSQLGIVFHTKYTGGPTLADMKASFGVDASRVKAKGCWIQDASIKDLGGTISWTKRQTAIVDRVIKLVETLMKKVDKSVLNAIAEDNALTVDMKAYINANIREGQAIRDTSKMSAGVIKHIQTKYQKQIDQLKTEKARDRKTAAMQLLLNTLEERKDQIKIIFDVMKAFQLCKNYITHKLEKIKGMTDTFVKTDTGFKVTAPEGFVAISGGKAVKLVDRLEFSMNNFNAVKNWD